MNTGLQTKLFIILLLPTHIGIVYTCDVKIKRARIISVIYDILCVPYFKFNQFYLTIKINEHKQKVFNLFLNFVNKHCDT